MQTILQFPVRNKGRVRKSTGYFAMGECIMSRGQHSNDNLVRLIEHRADAENYSNGDLGLFIASACFAVLTAEQKASMLRQLDFMATSDPRAVAVLRILRGPEGKA